MGILQLLFLAASVTLGWEPSTNAVSYRIYVSILPINGNPPVIWYPTSVPEYEVTGLDFGTTYFFRVTALNSAGAESGYSSELQYTPLIPALETIE